MSDENQQPDVPDADHGGDNTPDDDRKGRKRRDRIRTACAVVAAAAAVWRDRHGG